MRRGHGTTFLQLAHIYRSKKGVNVKKNLLLKELSGRLFVQEFNSQFYRLKYSSCILIPCFVENVLNFTAKKLLTIGKRVRGNFSTDHAMEREDEQQTNPCPRTASQLELGFTCM